MSRRKMTLEEFQQILEDAKVSTDFESILNKLVRYFYRASDESAADGHTAISGYYMRQGNSIYNILYRRGYYDEDK